MTIKAKYPGTCAVCGRRFAAGDSIDWIKGSGSRHASCDAAPSRKAPVAARKAAEPRAPKNDEHQITRPSKGRDDRYEPGQLVRLKDGTYWVVTVAGKSRDDDTDEWICWAYVRPATDAESATDRAKRGAADERKALLTELVALCRAGEQTPEIEVQGCPKGEQLVVAAGAHGSGREVAVLGEDGAVSLWCSGYYDDYRQSLWTTRDPRAVELFGALIGGAS